MSKKTYDIGTAQSTEVWRVFNRSKASNFLLIEFTLKLLKDECWNPGLWIIESLLNEDNTPRDETITPPGPASSASPVTKTVENLNPPRAMIRRFTSREHVNILQSMTVERGQHPPPTVETKTFKNRGQIIFSISISSKSCPLWKCLLTWICNLITFNVHWGKYRPIFDIIDTVL